MGRCTKILQKARNSVSNLRFEEACYLAECFGFTRYERAGSRKRGGSSHRIYQREGYIGFLNFQRAKDGKAKGYQVQQLLDLIEQLEAVPELDEEDGVEEDE